MCSRYTTCFPLQVFADFSTVSQVLNWICYGSFYESSSIKGNWVRLFSSYIWPTWHYCCLAQGLGQLFELYFFSIFKTFGQREAFGGSRGQESYRKYICISTYLWSNISNPSILPCQTCYYMYVVASQTFTDIWLSASFLWIHQCLPLDCGPLC
jgi:hypothetical protein